MDLKANTEKLLTQYLRRLTNLSGNNRSLFLPKLGGDQFLDLHALSHLNREKSFSILEALIHGKKKTISPVLDPRMEAANEASKQLKKLQRTDQFLFEERGSRDLHVAWPFVRGKFIDGTLVRCPLLFFPVELVIENEQWVLQPREDAEITFNKSFLLAYAFYNQVRPSEALLEENFEDTDRDLTVFRTALYQLLQAASIAINFNPDNYRDELIDFVQYKKDAFDELHKNGELKLFPEAVLGIFPQAGSYLVPDYLDLIENDKIADLEDFFISRNQGDDTQKGDNNFMAKVKEEKIYSAFTMDVWQENTLKAVKLGNSVVVQGPPGTGKSQLICNLISDRIALGKRVLVVCQKRAALDVVYERLRKQNLSPFIGLVHDFKNDRKALYEKIASQIERVDEYKTRNNSIDSIQLERKFYQSGRRIDQITDDLEEFRKDLFDESECGTSIKDLYLTSSPDKPAVNLKQEFNHFRFDTPPEFQSRLRAYAHYASQFEVDDHPWKERKSFAEFSASDKRELQHYIANVPAFFGEVSEKLKVLFGSTLDWIDCETLLDKKAEILEIRNLIDNEERFRFFLGKLGETDEETSALWLSNIERIIAECYQGVGPEVSVDSSQLGHFQAALTRSVKARKGLIGMIRWQFSKDKLFITRTLVANGLKSNPAGFATLEKKLDSRLNLEHNYSKLRARRWLSEFPEDYQLVTFQHWSQNHQRAIQAKLIFNAIRGIKNLIRPAMLNSDTLTEKLGRVYDVLETIPPQRALWLRYLTSNQISALTRDKDYPQLLLKSIRNDFEGLVEFDRLREGLSAVERAVISKLYDEAKTWDHETIEDLFLNSVKLAWIEHIENKHPSLTIVSSGKLSLLETELDEKILEKQNASGEILLMRAREQTIADLEFNRLNNRVTYRDLLHQATKKKKIWPLRKLVSEFEDELFKLVPCWLASPETVSAIFPMKEMFDLVIFDEASQCFAERGIPAMYRGKQVVVAGDDQQLRPSDLYSTRWQDDDFEHPDLDADSLLKLCSRYLLQTDLRSHYRSQSLALIDFSNRHFYQGRLSLLPDRKAVSPDEPCIEYLQVKGIWENNTNRLEAETIAGLLQDLNKRHPGKSIGIVTFNAPQQALIMDMLEEKGIPTTASIPEHVFVKNIENVQGDERDIIIFSVGYAADKKGKLSAQFGSLNMAGGENRLNVAITRAREKIFIVTSITPDKLRTESSVNIGPKLLKAYLQYAQEVSSGEFKPYIAPQTSPSKEFLKTRIKEWAETKFATAKLFENDLPTADLVLMINGKAVGIIITDDEYYHRSISAKERHGTLPALLEVKDWKYLSCYSRRFWQDPDKFFNEVAKFISQ